MPITRYSHKLACGHKHVTSAQVSDAVCSRCERVVDVVSVTEVTINDRGSGYIGAGRH